MATVSLKSIVLIHWTFVMWVMLGWPSAEIYIWSNLSVIAVGVWAVADRQSVDALFMFILMHLLSILMDIVFLSVYYNSYARTLTGQYLSTFKFSAAMCIINLILKPGSTLLTYKMYRDRGGEYNVNFGPDAPSYDQIGETANDFNGSNAQVSNVFPAPTTTQKSGNLLG